MSKFRIDPFEVAEYTLLFLISKALMLISESIKIGFISILEIIVSLEHELNTIRINKQKKVCLIIFYNLYY